MLGRVLGKVTTTEAGRRRAKRRGRVLGRRMSRSVCSLFDLLTFTILLLIIRANEATFRPRGS